MRLPALLALVLLLSGCAGLQGGTAAGAPTPTGYSTRLAAAVRDRGFDLSPAAGAPAKIRADEAITASKDFRPPGVAVAVHLARVWTPGFGSLDFGSPSHGAQHEFGHAPAWLVVYRGREDGTPGIWVVFVDAVTGEAKAMVGFGAHLRGGAPCPGGRCIFE